MHVYNTTKCHVHFLTHTHGTYSRFGNILTPGLTDATITSVHNTFIQLLYIEHLENMYQFLSVFCVISISVILIWLIVLSVS